MCVHLAYFLIFILLSQLASSYAAWMQFVAELEEGHVSRHTIYFSSLQSGLTEKELAQLPSFPAGKSGAYAFMTI